MNPARGAVPLVTPVTLTLLGLLVVLTSAVPAAWGAEPAAGGPSDRARQETARAELERITTELNGLDAWFGSADRKQARLEGKIAAHDRAVAAASTAVDLAEQTLRAAEQRQAELTSELGPLREARAQAARQVASHLGAAMRLAGQDFFKLVLNESDPLTLERMVRYHQYFGAARLRALERYNAALSAVDAREAALRDEIARIETERGTQKSRTEALGAARAESVALLARLEQTRSDQTETRARLEADRKRVADLVAALNRKALGLDGRSFGQSRGQLPWPVDGKVLHGFGQPRAEGRLRWQGMVIGAGVGSEFRVVQSGRVVFADWLRGFGMLAIVDHGGGYMTLYGQAESLARRVGDRVAPGDVLGRVGQSGGSGSVGVYFEVRERGQARDPAAWLARRR
jgi:septal ring factor EnvC (AmiA/AmiB activator)